MGLLTLGELAGLGAESSMVSEFLAREAARNSQQGDCSPCESGFTQRSGGLSTRGECERLMAQIRCQRRPPRPAPQPRPSVQPARPARPALDLEEAARREAEAARAEARHRRRMDELRAQVTAARKRRLELEARVPASASPAPPVLALGPAPMAIPAASRSVAGPLMAAAAAALIGFIALSR